MPDLVKSAEIDQRLSANIHPVTKVYCDEGGYICYERDGAPALIIDASSASGSRRVAYRRMLAMLRSAKYVADRDGSQVVFSLTISNTGKGLTYVQYQQQTEEAIKRSLEVEDGIKKNILKKFRTGI